MKKYTLIYEDKKGNELQRREIFEFNIQEARKTRDWELATTLINDCFKIKVKAA
jgi:hypothetical protein